MYIQEKPRVQSRPESAIRPEMFQAEFFTGLCDSRPNVEDTCMTYKPRLQWSSGKQHGQVPQKAPHIYYVSELNSFMVIVHSETFDYCQKFQHSHFQLWRFMYGLACNLEALSLGEHLINSESRFQHMSIKFLDL